MFASSAGVTSHITDLTDVSLEINRDMRARLGEASTLDSSMQEKNLSSPTPVATLTSPEDLPLPPGRAGPGGDGDKLQPALELVSSDFVLPCPAMVAVMMEV